MKNYIIIQTLADGSAQRIPLTDNLQLEAQSGATYTVVDAKTGKAIEGLKFIQEGKDLVITEAGEEVATIGSFYDQQATQMVDIVQQNVQDVPVGSGEEGAATWSAESSEAKPSSEGLSSAMILGGVAGLAALSVGIASVKGSASGAPASVVDMIAPTLQTVSAVGTTAVLTYSELLDPANLPAARDFSVLNGGVANVVTNVTITGKTVVLTLTTAVTTGSPLTIQYIDPTVGNDVNAIQDLAGNDAASFSTGLVADGYISGAQLYADLNGDGIADVNELLAGVVTDAKGMFILPVGTPAVPLLATGGTNIDSGLPNHLLMKSPAGSVVLNPLTTVVQNYLDANPGTTLAQAETAVQSVLGITLPAGVSLTQYDPLAANDVATQKVAVQLTEVANQAEVVSAGSSSTVFTNVAASSSPNAPVLDLAVVSTVAAMTVGIVGMSPELSVAVAAQNAQVALAATSGIIATQQSAPIVALTSDTGVANDLISSVGTLNIMGKVAGAAIQYSIDGGTTWASTFTAVVGVNNVQVRQVDAAGVAVSQVTTLNFTFDTAAPVVTLTAVTGAVGTVTGAITSGASSNDTAPVITGTTEAGATVNVYDGATLLGAANVTGINWTYTPATALVNGTTYSFNAIATDAVGNASAPTTNHVVIVDTLAPTVAITSDQTALAAGKTAVVTFTLSEASTNFALADIVVTGGALSALA
ncbi:MAG: SwmB domain-containing protein, partial [Mariprofundaceae bacterium]|nr:SwmB domain-containing protein [Mariprofundaceae bacterium]